MAFFDKPIVDKSSVNSEISEQKLATLLNQKNGFICRKDTPDKGVDFDVELIVENNASGWRFPLQLKSVQHPTLIDKGAFISYAFETSRLGYLMSRLPAMGLLVLYAVDTDSLYYDFIDKIYERLMEERGNTDWYANDKVNIKIPVSNHLTIEATTAIHEIFVKRFRQAAVMQQSHGAKYDLPSINLTGAFQYDFYNPDHVKKLLHDHGLLLLSMYDLKFVYDLITLLPNKDIIADKDLLLIAAVAYCEAGKHPDSVFYINRLLRKNDLSDEEKRIANFTKLKNSLALGEIDSDDFVRESSKMRDGKLSDVNDILLELNATFFQLLNIKTFHDIPRELVDSIDSVETRIQQLDCTETVKQLVELWNADNLAVLLSNIRHKNLVSSVSGKLWGKASPLRKRVQGSGSLFSSRKKYFLLLTA